MNFNFLTSMYAQNVCDCGITYWSNHSNKCGECYLEKPIRSNLKLEISEIKELYLKYFKGLSYFEIPDRHLRLSRNNINYVNAGICVYTPHFLQGKTPFNNENKFVNAQTCVRFDDYENVGVTNRHLTCFTMIGQHIFETDLQKFTGNWQELYFLQLFKFFLTLQPNLNVYIINESVWTDNINRGQSLEIFLDNIEIANQVYTFETIAGIELSYKYVDMGLGLERLCLVLNQKNSLMELFNLDCNSLILHDYIKTINKMYESGIYYSKKNVGYNLRVLIQRLFKLYPLEIILQNCKSQILQEHTLDQYYRWTKK